MPPASSAICIECEQAFPSDELVLIQHSWVCAQCKPIFLQRLIEGATLPGDGFWRMGKRLVAQLDTPFPDRCVKCNAPANGLRLKRDFFFLLSARKRVIVHVGLCEKHRARHQLGVIIGWIGVTLGPIMLFGGLAIGSGGFILGGLAVLFICGTSAALTATVAPTKVTRENIWLTGVHRDFLDSLPEWRGP